MGMNYDLVARAARAGLFNDVGHYKAPLIRPDGAVVFPSGIVRPDGTFRGAARLREMLLGLTEERVSAEEAETQTAYKPGCPCAYCQGHACPRCGGKGYGPFGPCCPECNGTGADALARAYMGEPW